MVFIILSIERGVSLKRLLKYVMKYKLRVIIPALTMLIAMIADMFNPYISKIIVDRVIEKKEYSLLSLLLLAILGITVLRAVFGYIKEYVADDLASKVSEDLKKDLYNHVQSLPYSYFDDMNTGELMARIGEDIDNIWKTVSFGFRLLLENAAYFIIATSILFYLNWKLALVTTLVVLPIAFIALKLEKEIGLTYGKISDQTATINTAAQENISGVRLVKAFAREKYEISKLLKLNNVNYDLNIEQASIVAKYFPLIEFLTNISIVAILCLGGYLVVKEDMSLGTLVAFIMYSGMLVWPMRMLGWLTNMLAQNKASAKKIFAIMDIVPAIKDNEDSIQLNEIKGEIKFNNVDFSYGEENILKNINLEVKAGETIALMGTTGSGKTSLINLIGRYYDVSKGDISVDGHNIKNIKLNSIRSKMAVVSQDTFLFSDTVEENIKMGKYDGTLEDIKKACECACALNFIEELPDGFQTVVGERGIGLSGGQKQRISIARALIRQASILILDDATSALDMETEYNLLRNLNTREEKPTTFIIAHRISAVKNADKILFLEDGEIVEKGTHEELLQLKGLYYEVYLEQFKDFNEDDREVI
ncbi:ABC transporter ATP-binding protein [Clostridium grantii]|uniref:ATP-binding cassette, subfamily B n=1 Tax=Clostridium grantii DSM 8605 TaxID=1121316 RepID=A0A1M5XA82_9CLOT|nr:ABC transporter ATP-binding protein [Clostridium grantii]SHH96686.1 ATP-binding cassette, subfamily B [Clostridium grantii DSM 8605]